MRIIDCHTFDTTLASIAAVAEMEPRTLAAALEAFDTDDWEAPTPGHFLWDTIVRRPPRPIDGVYWFHLSRVMEPASFRRHGILPLDQMLESVWAMIFDLIGNEQSDREKRDFRSHLESGRGNYAWGYDLKTRNPIHAGPYGMLAREVAFRPRDLSHHDYLETPEIIADICWAHAERFGSDLPARFEARSKPCIVKFLNGKGRSDLPTTVLMYMWSRLHGNKLLSRGHTCYDGEGKPVAPDQVIDLEIVQPVPGESNVYLPLVPVSSWQRH